MSESNVFPLVYPMSSPWAALEASLNAWRSWISPAHWFGGSKHAPALPAPARPGAEFSATRLATALFENVLAPALHLSKATIAPKRLSDACTDFVRDSFDLWQRASSPNPDVPVLTDSRFKSESWKNNPSLGFIAAWYLAGSRHLDRLANAVDADAKTQEQLRFFVHQWLAAVAPSNFLPLNPDAQRALLESNGESLRQGFTNLVNDIARGKMSQTDESQFAVGKNIATTEGSVVFENDLIQLIQYNPRTEAVFERPLLIVPPCINKYYILDLQPESSLVRHALDNGHQVFMVSWRNPDASLAHKTWDDYVEEGLVQSIEASTSISGQAQINALGFCIGGTLLSTALAVLAARGEQPVASLTLLTAMLDFSDTGLLGIFVDEAQVQSRELTIGGKDGAAPGLMRGAELATTFSFLRPNELVWNYVVDNYLKGQTPPAFNLLYWNSDSTNLPGPMYAWYMRNTYLENRLCEPNALTVCGQPVDFGAITVPTFIYGSREDHIVPWQTAYGARRLLNGPTTFVLGASGHIAGVVNPPSKNKRSYWTVEGDAATAEQPEAWLESASEQKGSWWPKWTNWLEQQGGEQIAPAAKAGSKKYPVIEAAPGRYVAQRD
jgi:polyhydroxyalkanoate synthase subunit PhaC